MTNRKRCRCEVYYQDRIYSTMSGDYLVFVYFMRTNLMGMFVSPYEEFQMVRFVYVWCTVWINHCVLLGNKCRHN